MSKKLPFMQIEIAALLNDTAQLSPCTFGIWMRMLLTMYYDSKNGEVSGTVERLARQFGATVEEMKNAIDELADTNVADVSHECPTNVTLVNRRMKNELASRQEEALRKSKQREKKQCPTNVPRMSHECPTNVPTHNSNSNNNSNNNTLLERVTSPVTAPVDNSKTDAQNSLSNPYKCSSFSDQTERLATLIETAHQFGECNDIGGVARRNAIHYQAEAFPASDPSIWFNAITEAITAATVGTRAGDIVTALRKYSDGILDNGKVSRCDELIRLTAQKLKAGACAKALAYLPDRRRRVAAVPESLRNEECGVF